MFINNLFRSWKYPAILLFGIGISNIGEWIYFIALNLIIFDMTGSPLAVAILYILKPFAALCTNVWAGSMIDRLNKRSLMVVLDLFRALFIGLLPFFSSLTIIYVLVLLINMGGSMFRPASMSYITKLIPSERRKRFNSLHSLINSGAFLIGPAIAGLIFLIGSPSLAIYLNAIAYLLSGMVTLLMPDIEKDSYKATATTKLSLALIRRDWKAVRRFSRNHVYIMLIYFLFNFVMVLAAAMDSLEAAFAKEVLALTNTEYGFLVSIAGAGIMVGAFINAILVKRLSISYLIGIGSIFIAAGYVIYAFSSNFTIAAIGFFVLAFFLAFANTGFLTFYQQNIPVDLMGRVGSVYALIEAGLTITLTILFGITAHLFSIQLVVIISSIGMFVVAAILFIFNIQSGKAHFYEQSEKSRSV